MAILRRGNQHERWIFPFCGLVASRRRQRREEEGLESRLSRPATLSYGYTPKGRWKQIYNHYSCFTYISREFGALCYVAVCAKLVYLRM